MIVCISWNNKSVFEQIGYFRYQRLLQRYFLALMILLGGHLYKSYVYRT
jgi:hypothetical protein